MRLTPYVFTSNSRLFLPPLIIPVQCTAEAFHARTGLHNCSDLSFKDVAEGALPTSSLSSAKAVGKPQDKEPSSTILEMTICSFALHLIESQSELFSLLWELRCAYLFVTWLVDSQSFSTKCRWLIVVAPHKKPEVHIIIYTSNTTLF